MIEILNNLLWSEPKPHPVGGKTLLLKSAAPTEEFWREYRLDKRGWFKKGISVKRQGGRYLVRWWSNEKGEFNA